MDRVRNPNSPNAGAPPPAFVGRDSLLDSFAVALQRELQRRGVYRTAHTPGTLREKL